MSSQLKEILAAHMVIIIVLLMKKRTIWHRWRLTQVQTHSTRHVLH